MSKYSPFIFFATHYLYRFIPILYLRVVQFMIFFWMLINFGFGANKSQGNIVMTSANYFNCNGSPYLVFSLLALFMLLLDDLPSAESIRLFSKHFVLQIVYLLCYSVGVEITIIFYFVFFGKIVFLVLLLVGQ